MNYVSIVIQGALTGTLLTLSFGAGFFALIHTSLSHGYRKGLLIAFGALASDAIYIFLSLFATSFVSTELPKYADTFRVVALIAFAGLGIHTIRKSTKVMNDGITDEPRKRVYYLTKGFLLNVVNPLILITWLGIAVYLESALKYSTLDLSLYFASVLVATFVSQAMICVFSHKIKSYLSDIFLHRLNIAIGILFIVLGIILFLNKEQPGTEFERASQLMGQ